MIQPIHNNYVIISRHKKEICQIWNIQNNYFIISQYKKKCKILNEPKGASTRNARNTVTCGWYQQKLLLLFDDNKIKMARKPAKKQKENPVECTGEGKRWKGNIWEGLIKSKMETVLELREGKTETVFEPSLEVRGQYLTH